MDGNEWPTLAFADSKLFGSASINPYSVKEVWLVANIYVTNIPGNAVYIISGRTNQVIGKLSVPSPGGIALAPGGQKIYVTSQSRNNVWIFNTRTKRLIGKVPVGQSPRGIAVTPSGLRIWVANSDSNNVSVIDANTQRVVRTLSTGQGPSQLAISPNTRTVYVSNSLSGTVSVYRTLAMTRVATIAVGKNPGHIAFTPGGKRAYVVNSGSNNISVIRTATRTEITKISVRYAGSRDPYGVAVSPNGKLLFVSEFLDSLLSIAIPSNRLVRKLIFSDETTGSKAPQGIAVFANRLYMVASANDQIEIRAIPSLKIVATIDVPSTLESEQGLAEIVVG